MQKIRAIFLVIMVLLAVTVSAQSPNVILTLADAITKEPLDDVYLTLIDGNKETDYFIDEDKNLKLNLDDGEHKFSFLINNPNTEGFDYYGSSSIKVEDKVIQVVYLYPIGSLNGFVKDRLENVIANANVKFECNKVININYPKKADQFGSFSLKAVPIGKCKVIGSFRDSFGTEEVQIKKGENTNVNIILNEVLIVPEESGSFWPYILGIIAIVMIIAYFSYSKKKDKPTSHSKEKKKEVKIQPKIEKKEETKKEPGIGQRGKDILKTLRDNEKKIVKFLVEHKKPVHLSMIHHKTGMSKGSLFRNLRSLEKKDIIEKFEEGRVKKVKLSSWFMN